MPLHVFHRDLQGFGSYFNPWMQRKGKPHLDTILGEGQHRFCGNCKCLCADCCSHTKAVQTPPPRTKTSNHTWWGIKPEKCVGTLGIPTLPLHLPPTHCKVTGAKNDFLHSSHPPSFRIAVGINPTQQLFFHAANDNQKKKPQTNNFCWGLNRPVPHFRAVLCMWPHGVKTHRVVSLSIFSDIYTLLFLRSLKWDKTTCSAWIIQSWHLHSSCPAGTKQPLPPFTTTGQCMAPQGELSQPLYCTS